MPDNSWLVAQGVQAASVVVETMGMLIHDLSLIVGTNDNAGCYSEESYADKARQLDSIYMDIMQNR